MQFVYNDGGRAAAGLRILKSQNDCVVRAIAIATGMPYTEVSEGIDAMAKRERRSKHRKEKSSAQSGVYPATTRRYMASLGWQWVPTMTIGSGCRVHLRSDELPRGRLIAKVSGHVVAVIDGVINDLVDCSRDGTRCVYGYYVKPE